MSAEEKQAEQTQKFDNLTPKALLIDEHIRVEWKPGSQVEIYSVSQSKWNRGKIVKIFEDGEGEWMVIKYDNSTKEIQRFDECVRPTADCRTLALLQVNMAAEEKSKKAAQFQEKMKSLRQTMKVPTDRDLLEYSKGVEMHHRGAASVEHSQCQLCKMYVDNASMEDHLRTVCPESLIECSLCQQRIERKNLLSHWKDGALCTGYMLHCKEARLASNFAEFKQYAFDEAYPNFNEEIKSAWCFDTDQKNTEAFKRLYLKSDVKVTHTICPKCNQRCAMPFEWDEHVNVCADYVNDPNFNDPEEIKYAWCFDTDQKNTEAFKRLYLKSDVNVTHTVCPKCDQRCAMPFEWDEHVCADYVNDPPPNHWQYYVMRLTESLMSSHGAVRAELWRVLCEQNCGAYVMRKNLQSHKYIVTCSVGCELQMLRQLQHVHETQQCLKRIVQCSFKKHGCPHEGITAEQLGQHDKENEMSHLKLQIRYLRETMHDQFGVINMYSGNTRNLATGWKLCDGTNGTVDLSVRFIPSNDDDQTDPKTYALCYIVKMPVDEPCN